MNCVKVKICGITRLQDAMDACELGADILGFNFVPASPRYLNPYAAREIISGLPPFVITMGIFAGEEPDIVNDLGDFLGIEDKLELGFLSPLPVSYQSGQQELPPGCNTEYMLPKASRNSSSSGI